jgi:hypothetical protein
VINGTETVSYAGKSWTANWMNTTVSGVTIDAIWDKATGVLLYQWRNDTFNTWTNITMVAISTIPKAPANTLGVPDVAGALCAAMGTVVMVFVVKRRTSVAPSK